MNLKFEYSLLASSLKNHQNLGKGIILVGRSNVGKSSIINAISASGRQAHISKRPGKTQTINFFSFNLNDDKFFLIDTPGYGFARVARSLQKEWKQSMDYLFNNATDYMVVCIQDALNPWSDSDKQLYDYISSFYQEVFLVFNKIDKLKQSEYFHLKSKNQHALYVSTKTKVGIENLSNKLQALLY